jgi:hypothetical protein
MLHLHKATASIIVTTNMRTNIAANITANFNMTTNIAV